MLIDQDKRQSRICPSQWIMGNYLQNNKADHLINMTVVDADRLMGTVTSRRLPSNGSADTHELFQDKLTVHAVISLACLCGNRRARIVGECLRQQSQLCLTAAAASHVPRPL